MPRPDGPVDEPVTGEPPSRLRVWKGRRLRTPGMPASRCRGRLWRCWRRAWNMQPGSRLSLRRFRRDCRGASRPPTGIFLLRIESIPEGNGGSGQHMSRHEERPIRRGKPRTIAGWGVSYPGNRVTPAGRNRALGLAQRAGCLLLIGLPGCRAAPPPPPPAPGRGNDASLADTLKQRIEEAYDFSRPGVVERMNALYPDTGRVISASGGHVIASADS